MFSTWMRSPKAIKFLPAFAAGLAAIVSPAISAGQAIPRIAEPIDESSLVTLKNSTHPLAQARFDRGPVEDSHIGRMLLVLKRSPEQERALQELVRDQQNQGSPNYHKWLTPEQFGERFGVADADVETVSSYLQANGFSVGRIYKNKNAIEVSGTAAQLRAAFHTDMHSYSIGGRKFYANANNPQIPAALAPVVQGFAALNNIRIGNTAAETAHSVPVTYEAESHRVRPQYTGNVGAGNFYLLAPVDIQTIYNIPVTTGSAGAGGNGVTVGVIGDSQINLDMIKRYQTLGGYGTNTPIEVVDGNDPGILPTTSGPDALIAYEQMELLTAAAPNATLNYYVSATTDYDTGLDFAIIRAVDDNAVSVLTMGFQTCEANLTLPGNYLVQTSWLQASAQGITVVAAAGDSGSAGCDVPSTATSASGGLAVNGYASTPYNIAVGGTDFYYGVIPNPANYWNATNTATYGSAKSYIPEQTWNDNIQTSDYVKSPTLPVILNAGGGGFSTLGNVNSDLTTQTFYPVPTWQIAAQVASGVPAPTARAIPDVAMFAGNNYNSAQYVICAAPADCMPSLTTATPIGGTAGAAAVFAGIMAEVVQKYGLQGNANPSLYGLHTTTGIFNSNAVSTSSNSVACSTGTGCSGGYLKSGGTNAYQAGLAFYSEATGLGSVNAGNLLSGFKNSETLATTTTLKVTNDASGTVVSTVVHGTPLRFTAKVTGTGTPTGNVAFTTGSPLSGYGGIIAEPLVAGTATATYNFFLPGGSYNLSARYAGDTTNLPSVASTPMTVTPEPSRTFIYSSTYASGSSVVYGTTVNVTAEPFSLNNNQVSTPTGTLGIYNNSNDPFIVMPLSSEGTATFSSFLLGGSATYNMVFGYSGDPSYQPSNTGANPYTIKVTPAPTTMTLGSTGSISFATPQTLTATVASTASLITGVPPTGTITFTNADGSQPVAATGTFSSTGQAIAEATIPVAVLSPQTQVSIAAGSLNATGIFVDGNFYTNPFFSNTASLDGHGYAYSGTKLGTTLSFGGYKYNFATAGQNDVVRGASGASSTIALPAGTYSILNFLATAYNGNQTGQTFTVKYSDNSTQTFTQSLSDWSASQGYTGESIALSTPYRDYYDGSSPAATFNVYQYTIPLNSAKTVSSFTVANNPNVSVLAVTLAKNSNQTFTVAYSGDANYQAVSQNTTISANNANYANTSGVSLAFSSNPVSTSGPLTINITATQSSGTPSGKVQLYANGVALGSPVTISSGAATPFVVPLTNGSLPFASGTVVITAVYTPALVTSAPSTSTTNLTVTDARTVGDFSISTNTPIQSITSSSNVVFFKVQLTALQNFAGLNVPIALSCTVPGSSNLTCALGLSSVTLGSSGAFVTTLKVAGQPTGGTGALHPPVQPDHWWLVGGGSALACVFILGIPARRKGLQGMMAALVCVVMLTGSITGCGSNSISGKALQGGSQFTSGGVHAAYTSGLATNNVNPGTYTVIISGTATSNTTLVHNTSVEVVVSTGIVLPNGSYSLTNFSNELMATDLNGSTTSGASLYFYAADGNTSPTDQKWTFTYQNNGYYTITNTANGLYMTDPAGGSPATATEATATGDGTQLWTLNPLDGGFEIVNAQSGGVLDDNGFGGSGTTVIVFPQKNILDGINQTWYIQ